MCAWQPGLGVDNVHRSELIYLEILRETPPFIIQDPTRSSGISPDLLRSHQIYWDLTRSTEISQYVPILPKISWLIFAFVISHILLFFFVIFLLVLHFEQLRILFLLSHLLYVDILTYLTHSAVIFAFRKRQSVSQSSLWIVEMLAHLKTADSL